MSETSFRFMVIEVFPESGRPTGNTDVRWASTARGALDQAAFQNATAVRMEAGETGAQSWARIVQTDSDGFDHFRS